MVAKADSRIKEQGLHKPFAEEFNREELNVLAATMYGFLKGFSNYVTPPPFVEKVDSEQIVYGYAKGNYFEEQYFLICRLDQLSRNEDFLAKLESTEWDLVIVDEAHKMSATYTGGEIKRTERFLLGEKLAKLTRHFLLMTATLSMELL